jgi:hypothetical protein
VNLATENFLDFHKGKGMEFNWRDFLKCPTEEEYVKMAIRSKCINYVIGYRKQICFRNWKHRTSNHSINAVVQ